MKKSFLLMVVSTMLLSLRANAGEYYPYVGADYVNSTVNVSDRMPDNYDIGRLSAGLKFVDFGSVEVFAERSTKEKKEYNSNVSRGRFYGFGADVLLNVYNLTDATILGSIGYGRMFSKLKYNGSTDKDIANTIRLGIEGEINPSPEWGFRAMYRYSLSDGDDYKNAKEFTIGARYYFYY